MTLPDEGKKTYRVLDYAERRQIALDHCAYLLKWYEGAKTRQRVLFQTALVSTIILSGVTPILILIESIPSIVQAIPAALVAIIVSANASFQWKENYLRFAHTFQLLQMERVLFKTCATDKYKVSIDQETALGNFTERIKIISLTEVTEWSELMKDSPDIGTGEE